MWVTLAKPELLRSGMYNYLYSSCPNLPHLSWSFMTMVTQFKQTIKVSKPTQLSLGLAEPNLFYMSCPYTFCVLLLLIRPDEMIKFDQITIASIKHRWPCQISLCGYCFFIKLTLHNYSEKWPYWQITPFFEGLSRFQFC